MKANQDPKHRMSRDDEGVSPVIAVILMVAITVVLAATVYVWVSGFSSDDSGPESAQIRASGFDSDNDGATDWIRLTLVKGENAPYDKDVVDLTALNHNSASFTKFCNTVALTSGNCTSAFSSGETWNAGAVKYIPCQGDGPHQLTVTIRDSTVLDQRVNCDEAAA